jgi:hypothetical protein
VTAPEHPNEIGGTVTAGEGHYAWVNDAGTYAYLSQTFGGSIFVFDISDPENPQKKGIFWDGDWNMAEKFTGRGDYLYVPTFDTLIIVDVSNANNPTKVGNFTDIYGGPAIDLFGDYAYVLTAETANAGDTERGFLNIYNITTPSGPTLQSRLKLHLRAWRLLAQGQYVYIVCNKTFLVVDVQNPFFPNILSRLEDQRLIIQHSHHSGDGRMRLRDGYLYILGGDHGNKELLCIIDVLNPENPKYINTLTWDQGGATDILTSGDYLFAGTYGGLFSIFDISNRESPVLLNHSGQTLPIDGWRYSWALGCLSGEYLIFPTLSHLQIADVPHTSEGLTGQVSVEAKLENVDVSNDEL